MLDRRIVNHAQNAVAALGEARQKIRLQAKMLAARAEQFHSDALELPIQPADRFTKPGHLAWPGVGRQRVAVLASDLEKFLQVRLRAVLGVFAAELGETALPVRFRPAVGALGLFRQREKCPGDPVAVGDLPGRDPVVRDDKKPGLLQRLPTVCTDTARCADETND